MDRTGHDVVIIGSGIAGLRAAIEAARSSEGKADVAVVTKLQAMRSHSVSAEGGTAAVLYPELGDSIESHIFDTVKGSDYLGDQDAIERFVKMMPAEIYQLEHWGMPWSRREDGRIAQRWFGGYTYPRATFAEDKVGFHEMQTLYDTCTKYDDITFYQEWFATSILVEQGEFRGVTAIEMKTGELSSISGKAGIIATGGAGRLYSFATYGHSSTPDGLAMGYRAGVPLKDMEFVQFHPSGLIPSGILITEGARADGGVLLNKDGERFMSRYAPEKLELASRDVVSRAMVTEIEEGRGFKDEASGYEYIELDLTKIGAEKVKAGLAGIREIAMKFRGIDPIERPLPVRPVCHYMMGGLRRRHRRGYADQGALGGRRGSVREHQRREQARRELHRGMPGLGAHHRYRGCTICDGQGKRFDSEAADAKRGEANLRRDISRERGDQSLRCEGLHPEGDGEGSLRLQDRGRIGGGHRHDSSAEGDRLSPLRRPQPAI